MSPSDVYSFLIITLVYITKSAHSQGLAELAKMAGLDVKELGLESSVNQKSSSSPDCGNCGNCPNCKGSSSSSGVPSLSGFDFGGYPMASSFGGYGGGYGNPLASMGLTGMGSNLVPSMNGFGGPFGGYGAPSPANFQPIPYQLMGGSATNQMGSRARYEPLDYNQGRARPISIGDYANSRDQGYANGDEDGSINGNGRHYMGSSDENGYEQGSRYPSQGGAYDGPHGGQVPASGPDGQYEYE